MVTVRLCQPFTQMTMKSKGGLPMLRRPRSMRILILYGFSFVALPLIFSLAYAAVYLDNLADKSQQTVYQTANFVRSSRTLSELLTSMERNARQFLVLRDPRLLQAYRETHLQFQQASHHLHAMQPGPQLSLHLDQLVDTEMQLYEDLNDVEIPPNTENTTIENRFELLTELASKVRNDSYQRIDKEVHSLRSGTADVLRMLFWFAVATIPLTLLTAGVFTVLITRPIARLDQAIRQLGNAQFEQPISVDGPQDLQFLGTRLDWLRENLRELENQKQCFLQHVSHELKTPLTAIREGTDLLKDAVVGPLSNDQKEIVGIIHTCTTKLQQLIEDLISFSTARLRSLELVRKTIHFEKEVNHVLTGHKPAIMAKSLQIETHLKPVTLDADRDKLRVIVDNLISNAVKFSPPYGLIKIQCFADMDRAILEVSDSGCGIDRCDQDKVFDAFFQGRDNVSATVRGSGLGLSIAKEYVDAHNGCIELVKKQSSPGAHFRLMLPAQQA